MNTLGLKKEVSSKWNLLKQLVLVMLLTMTGVLSAEASALRTFDFPIPFSDEQSAGEENDSVVTSGSAQMAGGVCTLYLSAYDSSGNYLYSWTEQHYAPTEGYCDWLLEQRIGELNTPN